MRDTHKDVDKSTVEKIPISFWLTESALVELAILNDKKEVVWTKKLNGKKGLNQFRWDLVYKKQESNSAYFFRYSQYLPVGEYELQLRNGVKTISKPLKINKLNYELSTQKEFSEFFHFF